VPAAYHFGLDDSTTFVQYSTVQCQSSGVQYTGVQYSAVQYHLALMTAGLASSGTAAPVQDTRMKSVSSPPAPPETQHATREPPHTVKSRVTGGTAGMPGSPVRGSQGSAQEGARARDCPRCT